MTASSQQAGTRGSVPTSYPAVGNRLGPKTVLITAESVSRYLASVGDTAFWDDSEPIARHFGFMVAPSSVIDGEMGSQLFRETYGTLGESLHAGQEFIQHLPLRIGCEYKITAEIEEVSEKRGIPYITFRSWCRTDGEVSLETRHVKAVHVPPRGGDGGQSREVCGDEVIARYGGNDAAEFPEVGAIVRGGRREIDEEMCREFSDIKDKGRTDNIHTNEELARRRGFERPIVKGLVTTVSELQLLRRLFRADWYLRGHLATKYVRPAPVGAALEAVAVVESSIPGVIRLRTAVLADDIVVAVGRAGCGQPVGHESGQDGLSQKTLE
jgi:hypothetical protein